MYRHRASPGAPGGGTGGGLNGPRVRNRRYSFSTERSPSCAPREL